MGVKRLNKYLANYEDSVFTHRTLKDFVNFMIPISENIYNIKNKNNKKIIMAIDTSLYIYKYMYSYDNFLFGFISQITRLLSNNIIPIYVFEGSPPIEKSDVLKMRNDKRIRLKDRILKIENEIKVLNNKKKISILEKEIQKLNKQIIYITKNDIYNIKKLLNIFNIPYINAVGESDSMFSYLYKEKIIDVCLSDDMDILVSGCYQMIKFDKGGIIHYDLNNILSKLNLTYTRFVEMCVIFGCDYIKPIPKLNNNIIYQLIQTNMTFHEIIRFINRNHIEPKIKSLLLENPDITKNQLFSYYRDVEPYIRAKEIYINSFKDEVIPEFNILDHSPQVICLDELNLFIIDIMKKSYNKTFVKRINRYVTNINKNLKM
jgi:5'-3' exonuclease